ncbi:hypothetical protein C8Q74DRAFT_1216780 [Fomes fomentarius]|nr:hypothetical protein C8Q74DRAFT_1216780 [Fomes fomentarius]
MRHEVPGAPDGRLHEQCDPPTLSRVPNQVSEYVLCARVDVEAVVSVKSSTAHCVEMAVVSGAFYVPMGLLFFCVLAISPQIYLIIKLMLRQPMEQAVEIEDKIKPSSGGWF